MPGADHRVVFIKWRSTYRFIPYNICKKGVFSIKTNMGCLRNGYALQEGAPIQGYQGIEVDVLKNAAHTTRYEALGLN